VRPLCALRVAFVAAFVSLSGEAAAHDFERTQVTLTFGADGSFVLDVTNDAAWFVHRLVPFNGPFTDRVVLFVDGREVRPDSIEYIGPSPTAAASLPRRSAEREGGSAVAGMLATYRMRGRMPLDARTLRWYYGLPIDPYPLTVRRADGRIIVQEIAGDAWSGSIDLAGQFHASRIGATTVGVAIAALLLLPLVIRFATKNTKGFVCFVVA
jgi:hypothetical protein